LIENYHIYSVDFLFFKKVAQIIAIQPYQTPIPNQCLKFEKKERIGFLKNEKVMPIIGYSLKISKKHSTLVKLIIHLDKLIFQT